MKDLSKKQKISLLYIITSLSLLIIAHFLPFENPWKLLVYLLPYLLVGTDVIKDAVCSLIHGEMLDEAFLMTAATVGAFALGEYDEAVAVMLFYQLGELLQSLAVGKSEKDLSKLMDLRPDTAAVRRNGTYVTVSPEEVLPGEVIQLRPGDKVPLDGIILSGKTTVNTMALTGEGLPRDLLPGDEILSGSVNLTGLITVQVKSPYAESTVSRILALVESAADRKSRSEQFVTRFAKIYTPCVVLAAVLLAVLPPLFDGNWSEWIRRALTFLVVSCPCALVVSVPLAFFCGIGGASGKGVLIKGAEYLEKLSSLSTVLFDKTGTLTNGSFTVTEIRPNGCSAAQLLEIAAYAESNSSHPIAAAIVAAYGKEIDQSALSGVTEYPGSGMKAILNGKTYAVGNRKMMASVNAACPDDAPDGTVVHVANGSSYLGSLIVSDTVKVGTSDALNALRELGIDQTVMLTGDNASAADRIAKTVAISAVHSDLLPIDKVQIAESYLNSKDTVAFVGDGINDAPVLMRADLGIAMGDFGSDAAMEAADIVLMHDDLNSLPTAVKISRKTMRIVRQNIIFALAVKFAVLLIGALGLLGSYSMWFAVFSDVGVTLLAVLNALRAFRVKP